MNTSKSTYITIAVLILILVLVFWYIMSLDNKQAQVDLSNSSATQALATPATSTAFTDLSGNAVDLTQYLGQVLVVNSWASWSPHSAVELQLLADSVSTYADDAVVVLAINRGEPVATAKSYLRSIGVDDRVTLILNPDDRYYETIEGYSMPETLFYDRKGNVIAHERGQLNQTEVTYHIQSALAVE
jgi:thiol-disulfide isomerase/thioredoxin